MSDDNAQVVTTAYEAFGRGDIPALLELMSDDVTWEVTEVLPQGGSFRGREGVGEFFAGVGREWPELKVDVELMATEGDHVIVIGRAEGPRASGEEAGYDFTHVFKVADGRIVDFREHAAPDASLR
jgi:ketosteroid isomerase-like protein